MLDVAIRSNKLSHTKLRRKGPRGGSSTNCCTQKSRSTRPLGDAHESRQGRTTASYIQLAPQPQEVAPILLGICRGIVVDGVVNETRLVFLDTWLKETPRSPNVGQVTCSRHGTQHPRRWTCHCRRSRDLTDTIAQIIGGTTYDIGTVSGMATRSLIDVKRLQFRNALFCLTGKFIYGTRQVRRSYHRSRWSDCRHR